LCKGCSGYQIAAAPAALAARVTAAVSWVLPMASLSAAFASVKHATVQQSNVSTITPQSRASASSTGDACTEPAMAGASGTAVAALSANDDSAWHGSNTSERCSTTILLQGNCTAWIVLSDLQLCFKPILDIRADALHSDCTCFGTTGSCTELLKQGIGQEDCSIDEAW